MLSRLRFVTCILRRRSSASAWGQDEVKIVTLQETLTMGFLA